MGDEMVMRRVMRRVTRGVMRGVMKGGRSRPEGMKCERHVREHVREPHEWEWMMNLQHAVEP